MVPWPFGRSPAGLPHGALHWRRSSLLRSLRASLDEVLPQRKITKVKTLRKGDPCRFGVVVLVALFFTPTVAGGWTSDLTRGFFQQTSSIHQGQVLVSSAMSLLASHTPDSCQVTDPIFIYSSIIIYRNGAFEYFRNSLLRLASPGGIDAST